MFHTSGYSHYPWLTNGGQVSVIVIAVALKQELFNLFQQIGILIKQVTFNYVSHYRYFSSPAVALLARRRVSRMVYPKNETNREPNCD